MTRVPRRPPSGYCDPRGGPWGNGPTDRFRGRARGGDADNEVAGRRIQVSRPTDGARPGASRRAHAARSDAVPFACVRGGNGGGVSRTGRVRRAGVAETSGQDRRRVHRGCEGFRRHVRSDGRHSASGTQSRVGPFDRRKPGHPDDGRFGRTCGSQAWPARRHSRRSLLAAARRGRHSGSLDSVRHAWKQRRDSGNHRAGRRSPVR